ncbi:MULTISPECIES: aminoacyl-tRNA hydrolase [unclassified Aureispira]|uniref:aminoacyl-tRNA hydrolase n=1 Tax=unclassified Aureispira TaxID=2649989 RepID=UPI0009DCD5DD|nr:MULTISPECIES: aminoacyl-tRNA hydrolase [unclassified Aureispira]WMX14851.1 aminoacyl-tRNA hydrolase [Aureispira sp. CCB-E]
MFKFIKRLFVNQELETSKIENSVKYLITGLGNIGPDYDGTRHNIGFDVVDYLADKFDVQYKSERYGMVGSFRHKGRTFILLKPNTYMNLSGQAIRYWLQKEKIKISNLLVILDDLNLSFGKVKVKSKGSAGGHNGLKNIEQLLSTSQYPRLRIGIGDRFGKGKQVDFVLGRWTNQEAADLPAIIKHAGQGVLNFGTIGLERTMNVTNKDLMAPPKKKKEKPNKEEKDGNES